jgi:hypothetical protein
MREKSNGYRLLVGEPEGKKPLGKPKHGWVYNIEMDVVQIAYGGVDWIGVVQDWCKWRALVNAIINLWVP